MRIYRKNARGSYEYSVLHYLEFWLFAVLVLIFLCAYIETKFSSRLVLSFEGFLWLVIAVLLVAEILKIIIGSYRKHGFFKFLSVKILEAKIRKALLNTMTLNLLKDTPKIQVPRIDVYFETNKIIVKIQKLPGMTDVERITENINSAVTGKYSTYAITTNIVSDDGVRFKFILENVGYNKTFIPTCINDLKQEPYFVTLQKGLTLNLSKYPHMAIWGQTGSGKTTVLMSIIAQCLSNNTDLLFIDGKTEFSSFSVFYPSNKIASDNDDVLKLLQHVSEIIVQRQKIMADEIKKRHELGLTGYDVGLNPIVIIADEVASIIASMDNKQKKELISCLIQIVLKGRSVSVFLVMATQNPGVEVLPSSIRNNFQTKILLGSADGNTQRMVFDQVATDGGVDKFQGYYMTSGLTIQPQKFYVPNLIKHNLENLETFEKIYKERDNV